MIYNNFYHIWCCKFKNNSINSNNANKNKLNKMTNKIPSSLKHNVWTTYIGEKYNGKCSVKWCNNRITPFTFEAGHNIPYSKGGSTTIDNLLPICSDCNKSMGNRYTIDEFSDTFINHNIVAVYKTKTKKEAEAEAEAETKTEDEAEAETKTICDNYNDTDTDTDTEASTKSNSKNKSKTKKNKTLMKHIQLFFGCFSRK